MSIEQNKAVVRTYLEDTWNNHRTDLVDKYLSEDIVLHSSTGDINLGEIKNTIPRMLNSFPDAKVKINFLIAEGDRVAVHQTVSGTHKAEFMGIPPTGKQFSFVGTAIFRLAGGKIAEILLVNDSLGLMQQLGVIPVPEASPQS